MATHNQLGLKGEQEAVCYLKELGYTILNQNWVHGKYEIDIIAQNDEYIVFVEVKTRSSNQWGNPEEAVTNGKIRRIVEAADFYLKGLDTDIPARFDIITAIWDGNSFNVEHIDDAFLATVS